MILVILAVCISLIFLGIRLIESYDYDGVAGLCIFIGSIIGVIALIVTVVLCCCVAGQSTIDEKIAMYQEENARIESQIAEVVEQYQKYEADIFTEVAPDSAMTLVTLYPELKSDELVKSQIDIYVENNKTIKSLKERKINKSVQKWWLFFGG